MAQTMPIVSVNTGIVAPLGERRGRQVRSGILKHPVMSGSLQLGELGLEGDEQEDKRKVRDTDRRIHGGPLKAVYFYPRAHYELWVPELGQALVPGMFGENVTVDDVLESEVFIGEVWEWGDALLEVTDHRRPCYKLNMLRGVGTSEAMMRNGRCGWYCKVLRPGTVPTRDALTRIHQPATGTTVLESFFAKVAREPIVPDMPDDD
jgi:MOSC domain-containing protein YiiM